MPAHRQRRCVSANQDLAAAPQPAGLVSPLPAHLRSPASPKSRRSAGSSSNTRSCSTRRNCSAYNLPLRDVMMAIQRSNNDVGGSVVEMSENEYMVRSRGYLHGLEDLAQGPGRRSAPGCGHADPARRDVATLQIAGEEAARRRRMERRGRSRRRRGHRALRRQCLSGHPGRQGEARRAGRRPAAGRHRSRPRTTART